MDFGYSARTQELQARLNAFMVEHVYPAEARYAQELRANTEAGKRWTPLQVIEELKPKARKAGLWNLFLPDSELGAGLSNQEYAPLAEIMGRAPAPDAAAWALDAVPASTRLAMPCRMAAMRNRL